jgi:hypothetical protein
MRSMWEWRARRPRAMDFGGWFCVCKGTDPCRKSFTGRFHEMGQQDNTGTRMEEER